MKHITRRILFCINFLTNSLQQYFLCTYKLNDEICYQVIDDMNILSDIYLHKLPINNITIFEYASELKYYYIFHINYNVTLYIRVYINTYTS